MYIIFILCFENITTEYFDWNMFYVILKRKKKLKKILSKEKTQLQKISKNGEAKIWEEGHWGPWGLNYAYPIPQFRSIDASFDEKTTNNKENLT